jgi:hypothetical protein
VSHCGPLQPAWSSAAFPRRAGGKWSAVQVARLLEAARRPFDASAVAVAVARNATRCLERAC